ncbi:MAG: hypothetical protein WBK94_00535 [Tenuifilaceae bacterium]|jgi:hypothetical protein|nr:hypothetical protein [Tenuifilaceae bacterium]
MAVKKVPFFLRFRLEKMSIFLCWQTFAMSKGIFMALKTATTECPYGLQHSQSALIYRKIL